MTERELTVTEQLLKHERRILLICLLLISTLAWFWTLSGSGTGMSLSAMTTSAFPPPEMPAMLHNWTLADVVIMLLMWWVMMIAMMVPSAGPMILLYARAYRHQQKLGRLPGAIAPTLMFATGYLLAWLGFSLIATVLHWFLEHIELIHSMTMWSINPLFSIMVLLVAGVYQLTPIKQSCLQHCRSPVSFITEHFQPGANGAIQMGLRHGLYCVGCCWVMMLLLFAGGVMNVLWIAALTLVVVVEKLVPFGGHIAKLSGVLLIGCAISLLICCV
ncbi:MAG: DUF2182 domain-containing protein [Gammaproteobacteria bacterium]|nr:DUF2182 domain-containing protein [Gammaproteobacteria bacterium]